MTRHDALHNDLLRRFADAPPLGELMATEAPDLPLPQQPRRAAVLVAFVARERPTLLLTRRQAHLRQHAGQVAFLGGGSDGDEDAATTALREAWEEAALPPDAVRIIGQMAAFRTFTGYAITPVLATIPPDLPLVPDAGEVARLFEAPCDILFDPAQRTLTRVEWQGAMRQYWESHVDGERVWGITAALIRAIGDALALEGEPQALNGFGMRRCA